jgi:hypothetical protein
VPRYAVFGGASLMLPGIAHDRFYYNKELQAVQALLEALDPSDTDGFQKFYQGRGTLVEEYATVRVIVLFDMSKVLSIFSVCRTLRGLGERASFVSIRRA